MMNDLAGMIPYDTIGLYEQPKPRFFFKMPRVVPEQKSKFESDELFRRLSRECEVSKRKVILRTIRRFLKWKIPLWISSWIYSNALLNATHIPILCSKNKNVCDLQYRAKKYLEIFWKNESHTQSRQDKTVHSKWEGERES